MNKLIVIMIILVLAIGGFIFINNYPLFNFTPVNRTASLDISSTVKQILPAAEFISLVYHYTDVITHSDALRLFDRLNVPFTERRAIFTIDGIIKLGFNGENISINGFGETIIVNMPAIKIISHEVFPETVNIYDERTGLIPYTIADSFAIQELQRHERERKVNENPSLFEQARSSAEHQFQRLLENIPGIKDEKKIEFRWEYN